MIRWSLLSPALVLAGLAAVSVPAADGQAPAAPIRIGMVQSFFVDIPQPLVDLVTDPFAPVMRQATGLQGQLTVGGDAFQIGQRLNDGTIQLGVFQGIEFAWAQEKYPDLRPLMIAINEHRLVKAYLMTRKDSGIASIADLKGKDFSMPRRTKEHCRLFVERGCQQAGQCGAKDFFKQVIVSSNVEVALDDVARGKIAAVIIDSLSLDFYRNLKPGLYANLKIAQESELFPAPVIAYRHGALSDATLSRLRDGMTNAHRLEQGRDMMSLWRVQAFEAIPLNFTQTLAETLKAYPSPEGAKVSLR